MVELEHEDIQGLIMFGYSHLECSAFLFINFADGAAARQWLTNVIPHITPAAASKGTEAQHIAISYEGLQEIGIGDDILSTFPLEYQEGMTDPDRARILGDIGDEDPSYWQFGGPNSGAKTVHALLMLFAVTPADCQALLSRQTALLEQTGAGAIVWQEISERPRDNDEHFGFRDGLSQPAIDGHPLPKSRLPGVNQLESAVAAGEFVLGYPNAYDQFPFSPTVGMDPTNLLTPDPNDTGRMSLGRNGTFLVFRKLQQHVSSFWGYFRQQAELDRADDTVAEMNRLAAKSVGRWRSGASLVISSSEDNRDKNNQFLYRNADALGERCPLGAHVRRGNPRDMLAPDTENNAVTIGHHRLLRRGRPYGQPVVHPETDKDDGADRGLLFIALNANLRRQFEFIQQTWINEPTFGGLYTDRDPVMGDDLTATFTIPGCPARRRLTGMPRFVTMRGGGYFFLPGLKALRFLAGLNGPTK